MMNEIVENIKKQFEQQFTKDPLLLRSPGRVNLIGEHTDYNAGFVLPAAIDKSIVFAIRARKDKHCRLFAADLNQEHEFEMNALKKSSKGWPNYLMGVVDQFSKEGIPLHGFDCAFGGNIPIASGLSSSAAIEGGLAMALNELFTLKLEKHKLVKLARKAENDFVGVRCGIMDQFINIFGRDRHVLLLDCRSLEYQYYPFQQDDIAIVLCDTRVHRELAFSEYNVRRDQCDKAVDILRRYDPAIENLRDVTPAFLEDHRQELDPVLHKRADYVVRENRRVLDGCHDLEQGDLHSFGKRMFESHRGLRDDYEVSSPELNVLVDLAADIPGVLGARMMGAGFGGCTINLVEKNAVDNFSTVMRENYRKKVGEDIAVYITQIEAGTAIIHE